MTTDTSGLGASDMVLAAERRPPAASPYDIRMPTMLDRSQPRRMLAVEWNRLRAHARSTSAVRALRRLRLGRHVTPVSREWGFDRGTPVDRYYVECFLARFAGFEGYAP